jgi:hypothetical protein
VEREIQLLGGKKTSSKGENAIVADESFKSASKVVAVEPVDHVTTITSTKSYCSSHVDFGHMFFDPVHDIYKIIVWCAAPVLPDSIREGLTISCRARNVRRDHNVCKSQSSRTIR